MDILEKQILGNLVNQMEQMNCKMDNLSAFFTRKNNVFDFEKPKPDDIPFVDFYWNWLQEHKKEIEPRTYIEYLKIYNTHIKPYFLDKDITLQSLTAEDIQMYYAVKISEKLSPNTVIKHHANIYSCLKYAKSKGLIEKNPMDEVKRPKAIKYIAAFYTPEQLLELFKIAKKTESDIYTAIILAGMLGLRRSEIAALKWSSIDFNQKTITIRRKAYLNVHNENVVIDRLKTQSSYRTFCLPGNLLKYLKSLKEQQSTFSNSTYSTKNFLDYVPRQIWLFNQFKYYNRFFSDINY